MTQDQETRSQLSSTTRDQIEMLARDLINGECLLFLGAGASVDRTSAEDLPTGAELSKLLAKKCRLAWHSYVPLSTTAFYYESFFTRSKLNALLKEEIENPDVRPSQTIRTLIEIVELLEQKGKHRQAFLITTNYDRHFEIAYRERRARDPHVIIYRGAEDPNKRGVQLNEGLDDDPEYWRPVEPGTYLYKMHGCISRVDPRADEHSVVITEEDYINFLANAAMSEDQDKWLAHEVRGKLALSTILFVGYSLSDWNFRVIFKATAERMQKRTSYAVQYFKPSANSVVRDQEERRWQAAVEFWLEKKVKIVNVDAASFMEHLLNAVRAEAGVKAPRG